MFWVKLLSSVRTRFFNVFCMSTLLQLQVFNFLSIDWVRFTIWPSKGPFPDLAAWTAKSTKSKSLINPLDKFQTNLIFYRGNIKQKTSLLCFSIKEQICLKLIKFFCCYSASTMTSFGFCSYSELLQLKFGEKKRCREMQIAPPPRQL